MKPFSVMFQEQHSNVIEYNGKIINSFFKFEQRGEFIFKFKFVSTNSEHKQEIRLACDQFDGSVEFRGKEIEFGKSRFKQVAFCETIENKQFEIKVVLKDGSLGIFNASEPGGSWVRGCAMIIEKKCQNKYRFYCNDFENDDDFDDLIFDLEILEFSDSNTGDGTMCSS